MHNAQARAELTLEGFVAAGQIKLDPFLTSAFVGLVKAELEKAHRLGRLGSDGAAEGYSAGLRRAADIVHTASSLSYDSPVPELLRAIETAIRRQADRIGVPS